MSNEYNKDRLIRYPVLSGIYYPEDPETLEELIRSFESGEDADGSGGTGGERPGVPWGKQRTGGISDGFSPHSREKARAVIAPHGAWAHCGGAAAAAFRACRGRNPLRVVLLGVLHGGGRRGILLSNSDSFETPLGRIPVDARTGEELSSCSTIIEIDDAPHLREHSLEVLLPFVKYYFPDAAIVPILMGFPSRNRIRALAGALRVVFQDRSGSTLFVISSCLSNAPAETEARKQAELFLRLLAEGDLPALKNGIFNGGISACGAAPAAALLESGLMEGYGPRFLQNEAGAIPHDAGCVCYGSVAYG
ncbi:MAG: AmmeMemoRadiSam system protein B [Treponema sp.]|nr:AmmeMemoRadiSam system protein B [Treponema sp.]